jgi:arylsulfatase A-like enzyme
MNENGPKPNRTNPIHDLWEDGKEIWNNGQYFTEVITEKAIAFIRQAVADEKPFFLYVPYNAPHYPMHAPEKYMKRFAHLTWDRQVMAAMLNAVDDSVGAIMTEVDSLSLADNTCTFLTSDNGPSRESRNWLDGSQDPYYGGTTGGLKGHKFSLFDGGIRVPGIMHWPGRIPAEQVLDFPCASMDIFPTLLTAAGGNPSEYEFDGMDLLPYISGGAMPSERNIFWEMGEQTAVRRGKWKLVLNGKLVEWAPVENTIQLSNLNEDMGEKKNLQGQHAEIASSLEAVALNWREGIEERWKQEFSPDTQGLVALASQRRESKDALQRAWDDLNR